MERARFHDGTQLRPRDALIDASGGSLRIYDAISGAVLKEWQWPEVVCMSAPGGGMQGVLSHRLEADCRLVVPDGAWADLILPNLVTPPRVFGAPMVAVLFLASLLFLAGLMIYSPYALDLVARFVPYSWEEKLGALAAEQLTKGHLCKGTPKAQQALERLARRLDAEDRSYEIYVIANPVPNALALPGRRIILFDGLLKAAGGPDEVAGVMAHETGHAHHRHGIRSFVQVVGAQILLGLALGDLTALETAANAAGQLLMLSGSREFERQADAYAVPALARNGIDPKGLRKFFQRMRAEEKDDSMPEWLQTHPVTDSRIKALDALETGLAVKKPARRAALTPAEWKAVRNFCQGRPPSPPAP